MVFFGSSDTGESEAEGRSETVDHRDRSSFVTDMLGAKSLCRFAGDGESLLGGKGCENDRRTGGRKWCKLGVIPNPLLSGYTDGDGASGRGGRGGGGPRGERLD